MTRRQQEKYPEEVRRQAVRLVFEHRDEYTHLFEGDLDEVMDRLDAHFPTESRPERVLGEVVHLPHTGKTPS